MEQSVAPPLDERLDAEADVEARLLALSRTRSANSRFILSESPGARLKGGGFSMKIRQAMEHLVVVDEAFPGMALRAHASRNGRAWSASGSPQADHRPGGHAPAPHEARSRRDVIIRGQWRRGIERGQAKSVTDLAAQEGVTDAYICRLLPLTCLAPDIVGAILDGQQPTGPRLAEMLGNGPLEWEEQRVRWVFGVVG